MPSPGPNTKTFVCPWWFIRSFDNPLRRIFHNPVPILADIVRPGDHCLDVGCGYGYFAIPLARLVGEKGRVTAVDIQPEMLEGLRRRLEKSGVEARVTVQLSGTSGLHLNEMFDFTLAFWMVHEVPDRAQLLREIADHLKPDGRFLLVEPIGHVRRTMFDETLGMAEKVGLAKIREVRVALSRAVVLGREPRN